MLGIVFIPLLVLISVPGYTASGDQGSATAVFLKLDPSARTTAMGSIRSDVSGDAFAASHNPAGLGFVDRADASFTRVDIFQGVSFNHGSMVKPIDQKSSLSFSYTGIDYGTQDRTEVGSGGFNDPVQNLGSFGADDLSLGLGYGRQIYDRHRIGGQIKYVGTTIESFNDSTMSMDLGWAYQLYPTIRIGVSGRNLMGELQLNEKSDPLPRMYDAGVSWNKYLNNNMSLGLSLYGSSPEDADFFLSFGGELGWRDTVFFRAGYNDEQEADNGLTFGGGLHWDPFEVDYSFEQFGELGNQSKLSISYEFGAPPASAKNEDKPAPSNRDTNNNKEPSRAVAPLTLDYPDEIEVPHNETGEFKVVAQGGAGKEFTPEMAEKPGNGQVESFVRLAPDEILVRYKPEKGYSGEDRLVMRMNGSKGSQEASVAVIVQEPPEPEPEPEPEQKTLEEQNKEAVQDFERVLEDLEYTGLPESVFVEESGDVIEVGVSSDILFDLAKDDPLEGSRDQIGQLADVLEEYPDRTIAIDGHTDDQPILSELQDQYADNWELSKARAASIAQVLVEKYEVDPERIQLNWFADEEPRVPNDNATNRFLNRRVEIKLYPPENGPGDDDGYQSAPEVLGES